MYVIRSLGGPQRLDIDVSGAVGETELLRMISQSAAMAIADGCQYVHCDVRSVLAGPSDRLVVAAMLAATGAPVRRIAFTATRDQVPHIREALRLGGMARSARCFATPAASIGWLARCETAGARSTTAARHAAASETDEGRSTAAIPGAGLGKAPAAA